MLAQEKVPKEKGTRSTHRLTPMPCVPRQSGARATRSFMGPASRPHKTCLEQGAHLFPDRLRYSVSATGPGLSTQTPLAQPSIAGILRASEPYCRAGFASRRRSKFCEFGERSKYREAQGTRFSGQAAGPRFFWVLFFGGAKKSTSPFMAKHKLGKLQKDSIALAKRSCTSRYTCEILPTEVTRSNHQKTSSHHPSRK